MNGFLAVITLTGLLSALVVANPILPNAEKKVVCYYGSWAVYRHGDGKFDVEQIDPFACTHIVYGFLGLSPENTILVLDPYNDEEENWGKGAMKRFTGLKEKNPNLKTLVAIGGWNEGSEKYSRMASDPAMRRTFVDSVIPFLQKHNFDGFDVDWEYPANREGAAPEDRENFVLLLNELRAKLNPAGYLLTAAVSAGAKTIETAYDIPAVLRALDFISVMAYNFHGAWEKFTGHHSGLFANPAIDYEDNIMLNTNYSINYWIQNGADPAKLILGIGTYGRGFVLDDISKNGLYAPAQQPINAGPYTSENGFWGYNEICEKFHQQQGQWTVVNDAVYQTPYAYNGRNWIGYDSPESVATKARYAKEMGLGGTMFWSVETDDFKGLYHTENFPLVRAAYRELNGEYPPPPPPPPATTENPSNTRPPTRPSTTVAPPPPTDMCSYEGPNPDPNDDCSAVYYNCDDDFNGEWVVHKQSCPSGTVFNPVSRSCDFPDNVAGCQN